MLDQPLDLMTDLIGHGVSLLGLVLFLNWRIARLEKSFAEYEVRLEKIVNSDGKIRERLARLEASLDLTPGRGRLAFVSDPDGNNS